MRRGELRFDRSPVTLKHHSARGTILRNTDNFTRGSQLISHQFMMFFAGVKIPFLVWLAIFLGVFAFMLAAVMGENEIQLCALRFYSKIWGWIDLSPYKQMSVRLPDGSDQMMSIGYIPYFPAVQVAWGKAVSALTGSFFFSILLALPLMWWFIDLSNKRGGSILEERHERGAMLVSRDILVADIAAHNEREFAKNARALFPGLNEKAVRALPFKRRKAAGLHHPYSLAGVPFPYGLEQSHTMIIGTTGSGKTTQLRNLVAQIRARQDSAVIFDLTGAYVEAFYNPETDTILNPLDKRCPSWSIFNDCTTQSEFTAAAAALVPVDGNNADPFWALAARTLFIEMCIKLLASGMGTNQALADNLMTADLKRVHKILQNTIADPITAPEAARMAESIRAVFNTNAQALRFLPTDGPDFSIREWIRRDDKPGSLLFVTSSYSDMTMNKTLLTLWMDLAINTTMTLPRTQSLRTWFMFDELGALHRLPAIESGLQTARGFGGAMILGMHSFARLKAIYGDEGAENLTSLARTKLILATADLDTAEHCARFIGNREVREMDEAYSYGYNSMRDASTLTPRKTVEPLVIPDDITNLPSLHGFVKFPDGFPAARIKLSYKDYPQVAPGFDRRADIAPLAPEAKEGDQASDGEHGGRDGGTEIIAAIAPGDLDRSSVAQRQAENLFADVDAPSSDVDVDKVLDAMTSPTNPAAGGLVDASSESADRVSQDVPDTSNPKEDRDRTNKELSYDFGDGMEGGM